MKRKLLPILLMFFILTLNGCAGHSAYMEKGENFSLQEPPPDKALVRFMRPSGFGFLQNFNILDGEKVIGNSLAKSQFDYITDPGKHLFIGTAENKAFLEADLAPGKTYYVITNIYTGAWRGRVKFVPVTRDSKFWDLVIQYQDNLRIIKPDKKKLMAWQLKNRDKITKLLNAYDSKWKNKYNWPVLNPDDGR